MNRFISVMCAILLIFLSVAHSFIASGNAVEDVKEPVMFQDFNNFTVLGTTNNNSDGTMRGDGYAHVGSSKYAALSLDTTYSYGNDDGSSLKYTAIEATTGDYNTSISLYTPETRGSAVKSLIVPEEATGFSFWLLNNSADGANFTIGILPEIAVSGSNTTYYRWGKTFASTDAAGVWTKYTVRFDDFGYKSDNYQTGGGSTCFPPRSFWDSVVGMQIRIGRIVKEGTNFNFDNVEWIFDNNITDFESDVLGDGSGHIQATANNYNSDAGDVPAQTLAEFFDASGAAINSSDSFLSDSGKSLKINLGTVVSGTKESSADLKSANPWIKISIPLNDVNLNGTGLRLWTRYENENDLAGNVQMRVRIVTSTGTYRHSQSGADLLPTNGLTNTTAHGMAIKMPYTGFKLNPGGTNQFGYASTNANLTASNLQNASMIEISLFPRVESSGGTVYIDGISVYEPAGRVTTGSGAPGDALIQGDEGYVGMTIVSSISTSAQYKLTGCDFYALNGYISIPVNADISAASLNGSYLAFNAAAPRQTKLKLTLYEEDGTQIGTSSAYAGIKSVDFDNPETIKVPISDFGTITNTVKAYLLKVEPAEGFADSYGFLKMGEAFAISDMRFTDTDPGTDAAQNLDVTPVSPTASVTLAEFNLNESSVWTDSGTQYLSKQAADDGEFKFTISGIDFYNSNNYIIMPLKYNNDFLTAKTTGYLVMDVKVPRDTRLTLQVNNSEWQSVSLMAGVQVSEQNADGYVTIKFPLYDAFANTSRDFTNLGQIRLLFRDNGFKNSVNFLNVGEIVGIKNMKIVSDDPGVSIKQNKHHDAKEIPAEANISNVNAASATITGSGWEKVSGDGDLNISVTEQSFYPATGTINLPVSNISDIRSNMEFGYFVFEAKVPNNTKLDFVMSGSGVSARAQVGIKGADSEFQTFKIPLKDLLLSGEFNVNALTAFSFEINESFRNDYNFLYTGETISFKNMRFISGDSYPAILQNKNLEHLLSRPKSPEEVEAEDSFLLYKQKDGGYTEASASTTYAGCAKVQTVSITRIDPNFQYFAKYTKYTVHDPDRFYAKSFPLLLTNSIDVSQRNMEYYLETATIRFWAYVEKDMDITVRLTDANYRSFNTQVSLKATGDGMFTEYQISLADYNTGASSVNWKNIIQVRILPITATTEGYLGKDEAICIASMEVWSKEAAEYDRYADLPAVYNYTAPNGKVTITAYNGLLPKETVTVITEYPSSTLTEWGVALPAGSTCSIMANVALYNAAGRSFEPGGRLWISMQIPAGADLSKLGLYSVFFDGSRMPLQYIVENGMISFSVYETGTFMLVINDNEWVPQGPLFPGFESPDIKTDLKPPVVNINKPGAPDNDNDVDYSEEDEDDEETAADADSEAEAEDDSEDGSGSRTRRGAKEAPTSNDNDGKVKEKVVNGWLIFAICAGGVLLIGAGVLSLFLLKKRARGKKTQGGNKL